MDMVRQVFSQLEKDGYGHVATSKGHTLFEINVDHLRKNIDILGLSAFDVNTAVGADKETVSGKCVQFAWSQAWALAWPKCFFLSVLLYLLTPALLHINILVFVSPVSSVNFKNDPRGY